MQILSVRVNLLAEPGVPGVQRMLRCERVAPFGVPGGPGRELNVDRVSPRTSRSARVKLFGRNGLSPGQKLLPGDRAVRVYHHEA